MTWARWWNREYISINICCSWCTERFSNQIITSLLSPKYQWRWEYLRLGTREKKVERTW